MSFHGSAVRIWRLTSGSEGVVKFALGTLAVTLILCAWTLVLCWYILFGLLLVPYRLIRRGSRKRKQQALQHREMLAAINQAQPAAPAQHVVPSAPSLTQETQKAPAALETPRGTAQEGYSHAEE